MDPIPIRRRRRRRTNWAWHLEWVREGTTPGHDTFPTREAAEIRARAIRQYGPHVTILLTHKDHGGWSTAYPIREAAIHGTTASGGAS
jgi:hypothetical protein